MSRLDGGALVVSEVDEAGFCTTEFDEVGRLRDAMIG